MTSKESLKTNNTKWNFTFWVLMALMMWAMMLGLFGCATQKKAEKYFAKHPVELAKKCAESFPVTEKYLPGDSVFVYDTLWGVETYTDTLISEPQVITEVKTVTVPKLVTKTVTIHDTLIRENTAKVFVLNSEIAKLSADIQDKNVKLSAMTDKRDIWRKRFFILLGLVVVYFGIKYRKLIKL